MKCTHTHTQTNKCWLELVFSIIVMISFSGFSQELPNINYTPNGVLDNLFDNYGNQYSFEDISISRNDSNNQRSVPITCVSNSMFTLYFDADSGMEEQSNLIHIARRSVVCKVMNDLSQFINSPLNHGASATKINIWVRDITQIDNLPANIAGVASGFYNLPAARTPTNANGGIVDNEIWKTIHAGTNSYANVVPPIATTEGAGNFYHGYMAINPSITWNTDLNNTTSSNTDLYTVVLHEMLHALGFASLISDDGTSKFGAGYNYYSRYDKFLENNNGQSLITSSSSLSPTMYDFIFNSATVGNLHSCTPNASTIDPENCVSEIRYVGTSTVPVYNPTCYENGSSLSHFEDSCYPPLPADPYGNNSYFVMSNATGTGIAKRFPKPEERLTLCDIGYSTQTSYDGTTYANATVCPGIVVVGVNDGIENGNYSFTADFNGVPIDLNNQSTGILINDFGATRFEGLQDVYDSTAQLPITSGTFGTTGVTFQSAIPGLHLLRYVPINGTQRGNITYVYVFLRSNCAEPSLCDLVINGDFEQFNSSPDNFSQLSRLCNVTDALLTPDFYHTSGTAGYNIPNTNGGDVNPMITNITNTNGFIGCILVRYPTTRYIESFGLQLKTPLQPNTDYVVTFNTINAPSFLPVSSIRYRFQVYFANTIAYTSIINNFVVNRTTPDILLNSPIISGLTTNWETVRIPFRTGNIAGEDHIYIGYFENGEIIDILTDCTFNCTSNLNRYFIDNVSVVSTEGSVLNLPTSICANDILPNLELYLSPAPTGGIFSGAGVSLVSGNYVFNASLAGVGIHTITYTYTNNVGCPISITSIIEVLNPVSPILSQTTAIIDCNNPTISLNTITANNLPTGFNLSWHTSTPATLSNTISSETVSQTGTYYAAFYNIVTGCYGPTSIVVVSENIIVSMNNPGNMLVCVGDQVNINFSSSNNCNITYTWTNSNTIIGLPASGTGDISFIATNANNTITKSGTITVTPHFGSITGTPITFVITVRQTIIINSATIPSLFYSVCPGSEVNNPLNPNSIFINVNNFTSSPAGATYNWTIVNPANTSLLSSQTSGTGIIPQFTLNSTQYDPTTSSYWVNVVVTPILNGCNGTPRVFKITINSIPVWNTFPDQLTYCNNLTVNLPDYSSTPAAVYSWTNSNTSIGLAASGTAQIPIFTTTNTTNDDLLATITISGVRLGCAIATTKSFVIRIKPTPTITNTNLNNIVVCTGQNVVIPQFTSGNPNVVFSWTNTKTTIGLGGSGTGNIANFLATNTTTSNIIATITVTPKLLKPDGTYCIGVSKTFTITVLKSNNLVANNDTFITPINTLTGGTTASVFANDTVNGVVVTASNISVEYISITPEINYPIISINTNGTILVPQYFPAGIYTITYKISISCEFKLATATFTVNQQVIPTPPLAFAIRANSTVTEIGVQSTGKIIIGGYFTEYNNIEQFSIARLNSDLTLDQTFQNPNPTFLHHYTPIDLIVQSDDKIVFIGYDADESQTGTSKSGIFRLNSDGTPDTTFGNNGAVFFGLDSIVNNIHYQTPYTIAIQNDGKILVGGFWFDKFNGVSVGQMFRLLSNGDLDTEFNDNYPYKGRDVNNMPLGSEVLKIVIQPDGKIIVGGHGYEYNYGQVHDQKSLFRLNSNGTLDTTFQRGTIRQIFSNSMCTSVRGEIIYDILLFNNSIYVVGAIDNYNGQNSVHNIIKLDPNGVFNPFSGFNSTVGKATNKNIFNVIVDDDKLLIAGDFSTFQEFITVNKIIRIDKNTGALDGSFNSGTGTTHVMENNNNSSCDNTYNYIKVLKKQTDGKILIGGNFTAFNGISATNITRIYGNNSVQIKSTVTDYTSEPEIDINADKDVIQIYPNPSNAIFTIDLTQTTTKYNNVTVYNLLGEKIYSGSLMPKQSNELDLSNLPIGCYLATLTSDEKSTQFKLLKN